jgi:hypothetical protein
MVQKGFPYANCIHERPLDPLVLRWVFFLNVFHFDIGNNNCFKE